MQSPEAQMQSAEKIIRTVLAESREAASGPLLDAYRSLGADAASAFVAVLINRLVVSEAQRRN